MKLNRMQVRRLVESVLNEATQSLFYLRQKVKDKFMSGLRLLETPEFKHKFGHYDWNRESISGNDMLSMGSKPRLTDNDIPVMWMVITPSYMLRPDLKDVLQTQIQESEVRSIMGQLNMLIGQDLEKMNYELATTTAARVRVKGSSPKKTITIIYLKDIKRLT